MVMVPTWTEMIPGNKTRLVVLADDGRVPEALLDPARKAPKLYEAGRSRCTTCFWSPQLEHI